ncbi:MAG: hypothetical protein KDJ77_01455 [Rhodobiaceae bacterium]|nr:hypothetical protein [Rhodobiaceae bacterium]
MAEPRSPLADIDVVRLCPNWQDRVGVRLTATLPVCVFQVQAWPGTVDALADALAPVIGARPDFGARTLTHGPAASAFPIGPGRMLVEAKDKATLAATREAISPDIGVVTDLTHARIRLDLDGADAATVLAKAINIDFHIDAMPVGTVAATGIHGIGVLMVRRGTEAFSLGVPRSFAGAIIEWFTAAAADVGYAIDG